MLGIQECGRPVHLWSSEAKPHVDGGLKGSLGLHIHERMWLQNSTKEPGPQVGSQRHKGIGVLSGVMMWNDSEKLAAREKWSRATELTFYRTRKAIRWGNNALLTLQQALHLERSHTNGLMGAHVNS